MVYDEQGSIIPRRLGQYRIFSADETPQLQAIWYRPTSPGPYGPKLWPRFPWTASGRPSSIGLSRTGKRFYQIPLIPERVWRGLGNKKSRQPYVRHAPTG